MKTASENVAKEGMTDRVSVEAWDLGKDSIAKGFDVAFVFNLLHNFSPETDRELLARVREALNPSGIVAIWHNFRSFGRLLNSAFDFLALTYLVSTGVQTYPSEEVWGCLSGAGFKKIRRYRTSPGLMTAVRPS